MGRPDRRGHFLRSHPDPPALGDTPHHRRLNPSLLDTHNPAARVPGDSFLGSEIDFELLSNDLQIYFYEVDWVEVRRPLPVASQQRPGIYALLVVLASLTVAAAITRLAHRTRLANHSSALFQR